AIRDARRVRYVEGEHRNSCDLPAAARNGNHVVTVAAERCNEVRSEESGRAGDPVAHGLPILPGKLKRLLEHEEERDVVALYRPGHEFSGSRRVRFFDDAREHGGRRLQYAVGSAVGFAGRNVARVRCDSYRPALFLAEREIKADWILH